MSTNSGTDKQVEARSHNRKRCSVKMDKLSPHMAGTNPPRRQSRNARDKSVRVGGVQTQPALSRVSQGHRHTKKMAQRSSDTWAIRIRRTVPALRAVGNGAAKEGGPGQRTRGFISQQR